MGRRLPLLLLMFAQCGDGGPPPHLLRIVADDGSLMGNSIIQAAVQEIEIIVVPDINDGRFEPSEPREIMGGDAEVRVSAAGEWVLKLRKRWIDENAEPSGSTFQVMVPIYTEQGEDAMVRDPTLRVAFLRNGVRIAESNPRFLQWPPPPGEVTVVNVFCPEMFRLQCLNND